MNSFIYPSDPKIIDGLVKCADYFHKTHGPALYPSPPSEDQLKEILNCSFAASLATEEGRTVTFTVAFFADREQKFPYHMSQPIPLSPQHLTRLAVALDPSRSCIGLIAGNTSLAIGGLIHLGEQDAFHSVSLKTTHFSIRVLGPGIMLVRYGMFLLLTYRQGTFAFHAGESGKLHEHVIGPCLSFRYGARNIDQLKTDCRFEVALKRITRTMLRQRHGGTILILPEGVDWEPAVSSALFAPATPVTSVKDANAQNLEYMTKRDEAFRQLMQGEANQEILHYWADDMIRSQFALELEWVGRLTATDGMTLIRPDLTLLGFGVFFKTQENEKNVTRVLLIDPYDDESAKEVKPLTSIGGARHQSAAVTCRRFPGATAIVASQDGSLTSMIRDENEDIVVVYRHLELLLDV